MNEICLWTQMCRYRTIKVRIYASIILPSRNGTEILTSKRYWLENVSKSRMIMNKSDQRSQTLTRRQRPVSRTINVDVAIKWARKMCHPPSDATQVKFHLFIIDEVWEEDYTCDQRQSEQSSRRTNLSSSSKGVSRRSSTWNFVVKANVEPV